MNYARSLATLTSSSTRLISILGVDLKIDLDYLVFMVFIWYLVFMNTNRNTNRNSYFRTSPKKTEPTKWWKFDSLRANLFIFKLLGVCVAGKLSQEFYYSAGRPASQTRTEIVVQTTVSDCRVVQIHVDEIGRRNEFVQISGCLRREVGVYDSIYLLVLFASILLK